MRRISSVPRPGWEGIIERQGLTYSLNQLRDAQGRPTGATSHYWNESAAYEFSMAEVLHLETVTEELHRMSLEAARFLAEESAKKNSPWRQLSIPDHALDYARVSLERGDLDLYGRFDLLYRDPSEPAKMLEYNADTPTGLIEAAVVQWFWKETVFPAADQWNSLHESLIERWGQLREARPDKMLYFAHTGLDDTGEDIMTTAYLRDCAQQAGWSTQGIEMTDIGYDYVADYFVDLDENIMNSVFKLYPWEDLMTEEFGPALALRAPSGWYEPAWKMFLSTKALSAALWHLYPGHENLIPTFLGETGGLTDYVRKPLHGREGDGITVVRNGIEEHHRGSGRYGAEGFVCQEWTPLPNFPGAFGEPNRAVLGSWIIGDEACGVGIRESDGWVTDPLCRFVPNIIRS